MPTPLATAQKPLSCFDKLEYIPISLSLRTLNPTLRSWMHRELIFMHGEGQGSDFILHVTIRLGQHHLLKMLSYFQWLLECGPVSGSSIPFL